MKFELLHNGEVYKIKPTDKVEWIVHNFGIEAKVETKTIFPMDIFANQNYCLQEASFLGNHFMRCKLTRQHLPPINLDFPIYVK